MIERHGSDKNETRCGDHPHAFASSSPLVFLLIALVALFAIAGCSSEQDQRLSEFRSLQSTGQINKAILALRSVLAKDADHPEANFLLGQSLLQTGQPEEAIAAFERAAAHDSFARPAGLLLASTLYNTRAYEEAIDAANRILDVDSSNSIALLTRGRSRLAFGQAQEAVEDADRILAEDASNRNARLLKSQSLLSLGMRDAAEEVWSSRFEALETSGNEDRAARACGDLALFYRNQSDAENADQTYQKCLALYPTHVFLQRWASHFYLRRGQLDRAIELHRNAVETTPDDLRLRARLANVLFRTGKDEEAEQTLLETVARFDSSEAWRLLADFHLKNGDAEEARNALEESLERADEPHQATLFSLADLFVAEGDFDRAREIGAQLTEPALQTLLEGTIDLSRGDAQAAIQKIDESLSIWPQNPRARYLAGQAAAALGNRNRMIVEFRNALQLSETATDAALRMAEIELENDQYRSAYQFAQRQILQRPYVDPAPYRIALQAAIALKDFEAAERVLNGLRNVDSEGLGSVIVEIAAIKRHQGGAQAAVDFVLASQKDLSDPSNEKLLRGLVNDFRTLERAREGLDYVDSAIARDSRIASLHDLRARVLSNLGRLDDAQESVQRALELDPRYAPAFESRAYLALDAGDTAAALSALDAAAAAAPESAQYSYAAAEISLDMGDNARAIAYLEEALSRKPQHAHAANDLAWLLADTRGDLDRALTLARVAASRIHPSKALDTLGWVRHQRGEFALAASSFRSALESDPSLTAVRFRLGLSLVALGEIDDARQVLQSLLNGPASPEVDRARAELAKLDES